MSAAASDASLPRFSSRSLAMMVHLSTAVGCFLSLSMTFGLAGPSVAWLILHGRDPFVARHAREALNFHLSVLAYALVLITLPTPPTVVAVFVVAWMALVIMISAKAYEGRPARYPGALPILRRPGKLRRG